ncbi:hypothetical protein AB837_00380 [bacterium AB1]|nr:hypothetical protein AB837_00380 [bacterium AB1]
MPSDITRYVLTLQQGTPFGQVPGKDKSLEKIANMGKIIRESGKEGDVAQIIKEDQDVVSSPQAKAFDFNPRDATRGELKKIKTLESLKTKSVKEKIDQHKEQLNQHYNLLTEQGVHCQTLMPNKISIEKNQEYLNVPYNIKEQKEKIFPKTIKQDSKTTDVDNSRRYCSIM